MTGSSIKCSTECAITGSPKLTYIPYTTYLYQYSVKSVVELRGVQGGVTETEWSAHVEFAWISPCDMVISLKEVTMDGGIPGVYVCNSPTDFSTNLQVKFMILNT